MRFALILALIIAVGAVAFALQNPAEMPVRLGPYIVTGSTALILLVTFALGALTGILAAIPGRWRANRRAKQLEKQLHTEPVVYKQTVDTPAPITTPETGTDPYAERFGPPPHQV